MLECHLFRQIDFDHIGFPFHHFQMIQLIFCVNYQVAFVAGFSGGRKSGNFLCREFKFDAAHNLVNYHGKCETLHGHTYRLAVVLKGEPDHEGMVFDFVELKKYVSDLVLSKLDHSYINNIIPI